MAEPRVLLFDVDGTLLVCGGGGRRAMERAFDEVYGRPDAMRDIDLRGMTDSRIFRCGIASIGARNDAQALRVLCEVYLRHLEHTIAESAGFRVLPGVPELLEELAHHPCVAVGLGTGNLERGARIKLRRADLDRHFAFGGFGSDHEDRAEMLRIGAARGAARLAVPLEACRIVVIGDTPRDVRAAQAIGADCVTVATGGHSADELWAAGATTVLAELAAPGAVAAIVR